MNLTTAERTTGLVIPASGAGAAAGTSTAGQRRGPASTSPCRPAITTASSCEWASSFISTFFT